MDKQKLHVMHVFVTFFSQYRRPCAKRETQTSVIQQDMLRLILLEELNVKCAYFISPHQFGSPTLLTSFPKRVAYLQLTLI